MSQHHAFIQWKRNTKDFAYESYDRTHQIKFEGGQSLSSSAAVEFLGKREHANPEELLAASAATCHMLTFLAICARSKITVNSYKDDAVAVLDKNANGKFAVVTIILNPKIEFEGPAPDAEKLKGLHEKAHANCFIANSLACPVMIQ